MSKETGHRAAISDSDKLDRLITMIRSLDERMQGIEGHLKSLEAMVDERLRETQPMWEAVLVRLDKLDADITAGFQRIERRIDPSLDSQSDESDEDRAELSDQDDLIN